MGKTYVDAKAREETLARGMVDEWMKEEGKRSKAAGRLQEGKDVGIERDFEWRERDREKEMWVWHEKCETCIGQGRSGCK